VSVQIVDVMSIADCERCHQVASAVWGSSSACSVAQMSVHANYGGVILLAVDGGEPVGFLFSFPARYQGDWVLWSHETAVLPSRNHEGIGYQLKLSQRTRAAGMGYPSIAWTFDPLVARNAYFNLHKLGATVAEYKLNVYGTDEGDLINRGLETDRLVAVWGTQPRTTRPTAMPEVGETVHVVLHRGDDGQPVMDPGGGADPICATEIPLDFQGLLDARVGVAKAWRYAFREAAQALFGRGYRPVAVRRNVGCTKYIWVQDGVTVNES
jgi:predicted GNAT superfamily acetyltransferase